MLNSLGHYEAISRNCPNYYLSAESVALFTDHLPSRPSYIIGQIVHIERRIVKAPIGAPRPGGDLADCPASSSSPSDSTGNRLNLNLGVGLNPFGLPLGCEYFVVTVAMLPDTAIHSPPSSWSGTKPNRNDGSRIKRRNKGLPNKGTVNNVWYAELEHSNLLPSLQGLCTAEWVSLVQSSLFVNKASL